MDTLIVYPESTEQLAAVKAVLKAMKVPFEQKMDAYPEHALQGVKRGWQQMQDGQLSPYTGR